MTACSNVMERAWPVGDRTATLSVSRTVPGGSISVRVEWSPSTPTSLKASEWQQYRAGRDQALAEISRELGINAAVLEI